MKKIVCCFIAIVAIPLSAMELPLKEKCSDRLSTQEKPSIQTKKKDVGAIAHLVEQIGNLPIDQQWEDAIAALEHGKSHFREKVGNALFNRKRLTFFLLSNYLENFALTESVEKGIDNKKLSKIISDKISLQSSHVAKTGLATTTLALNHAGTLLVLASANKGTIFRIPKLKELTNFEAMSPIICAVFQKKDTVFVINDHGWGRIDHNNNETQGGPILVKPRYIQASSNGMFCLTEHPNQLCIRDTDNAATERVRFSFSGPEQNHVTSFACDNNLTVVLLVFRNKFLCRGEKKEAQFDTNFFLEENTPNYISNVFDVPTYISKVGVSNYISNVDVSNDGQYGLSYGDNHGFIYKFGPSSTTVERELRMESEISVARFSPCGNYIAFGFARENFSLWDWQNDVQLVFCKIPHAQTLTHVTLSGDGDTIAATTDYCLFLTSCKRLRRLPACAKAVLSRLERGKSNEELVKTATFKRVFEGLDPELQKKIIDDFKINVSCQR